MSLRLSQSCTFEGEVIGDTIVSLGVGCWIGPGVRFTGGGIIKFGDYCKVHNNTVINTGGPKGRVEFGHNCWIGERSVLDGTGQLLAGNNIGVGIASQLYSHISHGDVMAGCKFNSRKPLEICDDAWFVGQCLVSPVFIGERVVVLLGSTVTKDLQDNRVYAGVPAVDITHKTGAPWGITTDAERLEMFEKHVSDWASFGGDVSKIRGCVGLPDGFENDDITYFDVSTMKYVPRRTIDEISFMEFLVSYKARFVPILKQKE